MDTPRYVAPVAEEVGSFQELTNGLWFGDYTDLFGARATIKLNPDE